MEICETQISTIKLVIDVLGLVVGVMALVVAVIALLVAIFGPRYYHKKTSERENKERTPLLEPFRFGRTSLQEFHFWYKNFGQSVAKSIKIDYDIENLGEVIIDEDGFSLSSYKTTLASGDKTAVTFKWTSEEPLTDEYHGKVHVIITYEGDFYKPEPIKFSIVIKDGEYKAPF